MQRWKEEIEQEGLKEVGYLTERLTKLKCNLNECNLGNLVADAFVHYYATKIPSPKDQWTSAAIALVPAGGLRAPLEKGGNQSFKYIILLFAVYCTNLSMGFSGNLW